jgi:death-on-curing protein
MARKCAALVHAIVGNHGFVDGNKRTAWLLVELLIGRSGYWLDIPDDARVDDFVVAVASGSLSFDEITDWFDRRLVRG